MAKRDPAKAALRQAEKELTNLLMPMAAHVMARLGEPTLLSLHARIGGKNAAFIDLKNAVIPSPEAFVALWLRGFVRVLRGRPEGDNYWEVYVAMRDDKVVRDYVLAFLKRTYLRNARALSRVRPTLDEAQVWIGQNHISFGLLVAPRFVSGQWENDKSEIRHFPKHYFTIGHVLETGLVVPGKNSVMRFADVEQYLTFFESTLVRPAKSAHQDAIAERYSNYVRAHSDAESVPLLIPEFRYGGAAAKHVYRLDFVVIDPFTIAKVGFELSPWSVHGALTGTKGKTQAQINDEALLNFEREMKKRKDFFREHGLFTLIYTDADLADPGKVFADIAKYLDPRSAPQQLEILALDEFLRFRPA